MDELRRMLKQRLRQGFSQQQLADQLGIHRNTLGFILRGYRDPTRKLLKKLGLKRVVTYVPIDGLLSLDENVRQCEQRPDDQPLPAPVSPRTQPVIISARDIGRHGKLTVDRVQVALRCGLTPGVAWQAFIGSGEDDWEQWCEDNALIDERELVMAEESHPLGKPGELYNHLKPVIRGQDHRGGIEVVTTGIAQGGVRVVPREHE